VNYPLFYKMQINDKKGLQTIVTPLQIALEENQILAMNEMIKYIIEHQNSFCFFNLFEDTLIEMIEMGV
jgi:hypothetical protein